MAQNNLYDILFRDQVNSLLVEHIIRRGDAPRAKNHFHNHLEIYYLTAGERIYFIRDRTYHIRPGDMVVLSSNIVHRAYSVGGGSPNHERIILEVYQPMLASMRELFGRSGPEEALRGVFGVLRLGQEEQSQVRSWIYGIMREMKERQYGYEAMVRCIMAQLLAFIIRRMSQEASAERVTAKNTRMLEIADYLAAHSNQKLSLDKIAERFYISKYHLCRTFKQATGFTLAEYINTSRVMRARELLLTTRSSITEIAEETGFESGTHFGKVFKQYMGTPPLAYRKTFQGELGVGEREKKGE
ncbi:MAG: helix-turn-helix domain-containing protein [Oscillospiraceae bacterium]|mgnify:CR=1 FL=1|nr:helix-turn-helix domain-containing protein [Oscillospiraceae bacterium]